MISLDFTLFIQMGLFLTLMVVLNLFVFRPLVSMLEERERRIKEPGSNAKEMDAEVEKMRAKYEATLNETKLKAIEERNRIRKEGTDREQEIVKEAQKASEATLAEVRANIEKELSVARQALKAEAQAISSDVAGKLIGRAI